MSISALFQQLFQNVLVLVAAPLLLGWLNQCRAWLQNRRAPGLLQPFRLIAMPALQSAVIEWQSPNFQHFSPLEAWLLGLIAIGFASGIKLPPLRLVLLLGLYMPPYLAAWYRQAARLIG